MDIPIRLHVFYAASTTGGLPHENEPLSIYKEERHTRR